MSTADPTETTRCGTALWPLTAAEIASLADGRLLRGAEVLGHRVITDSRTPARHGDVFFGLTGPHFDGGRFALAALNAGATIAVVRPEVAALLADSAPTGTAVIAVEQPLAALQALAAEARRSFTGTLVAIAGSEGKTTVKEQLVAALAGERRLYASPRSYNSQVGVALSLLMLDRRAEVAIIECGVSQPGEMDRLETMVRPDHGLLTRVGEAHLEGFGSRNAVAVEQSRLFRRLRSGAWILTSGGEAVGRGALATASGRILTVGGDGSPDFTFTAARDGEAARIERDGESVSLPLAGGSRQTIARQLIENGALAAAAALLLGATPAAIERGLESWRPASMRLEMSTMPSGVLLINDGYTADATSAEAALATLAGEHAPATQAVAILGGMAHLGELGGESHRQVGRRLWELGIDRLIGVGDGGAEIAQAAARAGMPEPKIHTVADLPAAALLVEQHCRSGDRVLLKASRPLRLERAAHLLFASLPPARLYVDLDALLANYRRIRHHLGEGVAIMAVVKSFGYGLDAAPLARTLLAAGLDYLAVAYPDEGVRLRDRGIKAPILVQNILEQEIEKVVRYGLTAQVSDRAQIDWLDAEGERLGTCISVHLKIDSGMSRAGAFPEDAPQLARALAEARWLEFEGLMTHLSSADDAAGDAHTHQQLRRFDAVRRQLAEAGHRPRWIHAANSAAIQRFETARYTMVRAGLALWGYSRPITAADEAPSPIVQQPILRLVTRIVSIKKVPAGRGVGYGLTYETPADGGERTIAVVAIGYGDGYPWSLSNRGWMAVHGQRCPVVGRVCIDVTMIDVTTIDGAVQAGDEVVVFGPEQDEPSLLELAEKAGTIPYEMLTRISPRVRRIFRSSH